MKIPEKKIFYVLVTIIFFIISLFLCYKYYQKVVSVYRHSDVLSVKEKHELKYAVCMKENSYFAAACLGMNEESYVYAYTDHIEITNNYTTQLSENWDTKYEYKVIANLIVRHAKSTAGGPIIWSKPYRLDDNKTMGTFNSSKAISKTISINLDTYKKAAEEFAKTIDVPVSAEIRIDFTTSLTGTEDRFKSNYLRSITIPLSDSIYKIELSDNKDKITDYNVSNKSLFTIGFFAASLSIVLCWLLIFLAIKGYLAESSVYLATVNKYLKTYDDLIVNTDSPLKFSDYKNININNFKELLDLASTTNLPIMHYESSRGAIFYIYYHNMIYMHLVKKEK